MENLKDVKEFIKVVSENYNKEQNWLDLPSVTVRGNGKSGIDWKNYMYRRSQNGNDVRKAGIESISSGCQRSMMFSMFGVSQYKLGAGDEINKPQGGTVFNNEIDRIMTEHGGGRWLMGNKPADDTKKYGQGGLFYNFRNYPDYKNVTGNSVSGFRGVWDFHDLRGNVLIELKSVWKKDENKGNGLTAWEDEDWTAPGFKARRQLAIYVNNIRKPVFGGWVLYLPSDLSTLDPENPETYRAFYMSKKDAKKIVDTEITPVVEDSVFRLNWNRDNRDNSVLRWGTLTWFMAVINSVPLCGGECCSRSQEWYETKEVRDDWYVVSDY